MLGVVAANMVRAIRTISVERGHDPRRFALMPFGGAGPLHARDVAQALGMREIVVPAAPGILCAQGLVVSDLKEDFVAGHRLPVDGSTEGAIRQQVARAARPGAGLVRPRGGPPWRTSARAQARSALRRPELRARRCPSTSTSCPTPMACAPASSRPHETAYGYCNPQDPVEVVNFRLTARGRLHRPPPTEEVATAAGTPAPLERREVWFAPDGALPTPVYERAALRPGQRLLGPAVIEQLDATTLVFPGDHARVDAAANLLIESAA